LQGVGGLALGVVVGFLPEDAGAAFGADDAVVGELEHADAVADADAERSAGPPSPMTMQMICVSSRAISSRLVAISWAWPRSSAPMPGTGRAGPIGQRLG